MGKRAQQRAATPVVLGWIVVRKWKTQQGKESSKRVSPRMTSVDSATTFRNIAARSYLPNEDERDVDFVVEGDHGFDDIPAKL